MLDIASKCVPASTPLPRIARIPESRGAIASATAADTAAVRIAVRKVPSTTASGAPVCGSTSNTVAMTVGIAVPAFLA